MNTTSTREGYQCHKGNKNTSYIFALRHFISLGRTNYHQDNLKAIWGKRNRK